MNKRDIFFGITMFSLFQLLLILICCMIFGMNESICYLFFINLLIVSISTFELIYSPTYR